MRVLLCIVVLVTLSLPSEPANAQASYWVYKRINRTYEAINAEDYAEALKQLAELKRIKGLKPYDEALMWHAYGHVFFMQERFPEAAKAMEAALALDALEAHKINEMHFNLGQLYMAQELWTKAAGHFDRWLALEPKPSAGDRFLVSHAYINTKRFTDAYDQLILCIKDTERPKESWLQTLGSVQYTLELKQELPKTLETLLNLYPQQSYWLQLGQAHLDLGDHPRALAVFELAWKGGYLTEASHLMQLVQMYNNQGLPEKAALVLAEAIELGRVERSSDNLKLLADTHLRSKDLDKVVSPLTEAAETSNNPDLFLRLAQLNLETLDWKAAITAANRALAIGQLDDPGHAYMLLGVAHYLGDELQDARRALIRAQRSSNSTHANVATQWLSVIDSRSAYQQVSRRYNRAKSNMRLRRE